MSKPIQLRTAHLDIESLLAKFNNEDGVGIGYKVPSSDTIEGTPFESEVFNHLSLDSVGEQVGVGDVSALTSTTPTTNITEDGPFRGQYQAIEKQDENKNINENDKNDILYPLATGSKETIVGSPFSSPAILDGIVLDTPLDLLLMLDDNILNGTVKLHDWQIRFMVDFSNENHTKESPFQAAVQACNSSGKDKYIIAACAVWLCMRYQETDCPITSSSGNQLDNQTAVHIDRLCNSANAKFGAMWKINYRYYECKFTNPDGITRISTIKLFATDEPGKAEGFHPVDSGRKMAIFTSETKSIPTDITDALERCTGFTHRVDASSPGLPVGYFYNVCTSAIPRESLDNIKSLRSTQTIVYKITAYQCSHITPAEIERIASKLIGGRNNVIFKSSVEAEFGSTDEMVVIPSTFVWNCVRNKKPIWYRESFNTGGLDFSDGGAETVLCIRNGNKLIGMEPFRFQDTQDTINYLIEKFLYWKLNAKGSKIYGDCCGIGKPMLDSLKALKWNNVVYVDSRNSPSEKFTYSNRATELFFNVAKLMAKTELIIPEDKLLITQLCTRFYKINSDNISALLTKKEMRSKGFVSPDRADAFNLAFWKYKSNIPDLEAPTDSPVEELDEIPDKIVPVFDIREWANRDSKPFQPEHNDLSELKEQIREYNKLLQTSRN